MREGESLAAKGHIRKTHRHNSMVMARGKGEGAGRKWTKDEGNGDICNSVNNKNKGIFKNILYSKK